MRNLLFVGATHGDEAIGVDTLYEIEQIYDRKDYGYDWIIGNPRAFQANVRFTGSDLNRSAPGNPGSTIYEERRAAEIIEISKSYDAMIDIHGTVADCGITTIIPKPNAENLALARSLPVARNVIWYAQESELSGPLVQHTACAAVEIECGPKNNSAIKAQLKGIIGQILLANRGETITDTSIQEFYDVYGPLEGAWDTKIQDFQPTTFDGETFYPFLSSQYKGITCYKMINVIPEEVML